MRTLLTQDEGNDLLRDYYPMFTDIFNKSLTELNKAIVNDTANGYTEFASRTKSNLMWHYAMNISAQVFKEHPEFKPQVFNGVYFLCLHNTLLLRIKKLDRNRLASNIDTEQQKKMYTQGTLPGIPATPPILILGYEPSVTWTGINSIHITCPKNKNENRWAINTNSKYGIDKTIPFIDLQEEVSPEIEKLLKIRDDKKRKQGNAE